MLIIFIIILIVYGNCIAQHLQFRSLYEKIKDINSQYRCYNNTNINFSHKQYIVSVPDSEDYRNTTSKTYKGTILKNYIGVSWTSKEGVNIYDGPDHKVLEILLNNKEVHLQFTKQNTYEELIEALVNKSVDLLLTPLYYSEDRYNNTDFTTPLLSSPYCLVMRRENSFSIVLLLPYQPLVWLILGLSFLCAVLAWLAVKKHGRVRKPLYNQITSLFDAVFDAVQMVLNNGYSRPAFSLPQRQMIIILMVFSLVLGNAYSGQLLVFLAAPPKSKDPQTLLEATSKINHIYMNENMVKIFKDMDKDIIVKFKTTLHHKSDNTIRDIITNKKSGVVLNSESYLTISASPVGEKQNAFHVVPECFVFPGYGSYLIVKKSPIYDQLNRITLGIVESGLYTHWTEAQTHARAANGVIELHNDAKEEPEPLTLKQLSGIFMVIQLGLVTSISAFIIELIFKISYQGMIRKPKVVQ